MRTTIHVSNVLSAALTEETFAMKWLDDGAIVEESEFDDWDLFVGAVNGTEIESNDGDVVIEPHGTLGETDICVERRFERLKKYPEMLREMKKREKDNPEGESTESGVMSAPDLTQSPGLIE